MSIRYSFASATALILIAAAGHAQSTVPDQVVSELTSQGYSRIEVKTGPTQTKVEAIRGDRQLEAVYDTATGAILKQEVNMVGADDDTTPGVERDIRDRDFVDASGQMDDDNDEHRGRGRGLDDDDDDDGDHQGRGRDRGRGADDNDDGDHQGRGRGADDGADGDHQGRGRGSDDND